MAVLSLSFKILLLSIRVVRALCLSLSHSLKILSLFVYPCIRVYRLRNTPPSYRQPSGRGQLFSRRYCTQSGVSSVRAVRPRVPRRLRFRVSTSNSLSGLSRPPTTRQCQIDHTYVQQDIRVCEDDLLSRPMAVLIPRLFSFFVSI